MSSQLPREATDMLRYIIAFCMLTLPAMAEEVVLGLSKDEVAITTSFDGSDV